MTSSYAYSAAETLLRVSHLNVTIDGNVILKDVDFEIRDLKRVDGVVEGQKVALLAPSGVGKTTLFKSIAGLEPPTSGTVMVGDPQRPVHAGMVGVVPQNYLLFNHRTVGSSLTLAASMHGHAGPEQAARAMLQDMGLSDKWKSYPCELSGGQRQRVSIAEQLLSSSHFLLMDEPFSGLDVISKKRVCDVIDGVAALDDVNTIIFSTHDIESAVMVADTAIILGRDHAADGSIIPGARVQRVIDLIDRDLAWHQDVEHMPQFASTVAEIKTLFATL